MNAMPFSSAMRRIVLSDTPSIAAALGSDT
jgi:hypothetical protein